MRAPSFVLALFLAAVSFVAAAPSPSPAAGTGSVQSITDAITNATSHLSPLAANLASTAQQNPVDPSSVSVILGEVTAVIDTTSEQLQALANVDLSDGDLLGLGAAVFELIGSVTSVLSTILFLKGLTSGIFDTLGAVIQTLLDAVKVLLSALSPFGVGVLVSVVGAVVGLVNGVLDILLL